MISIISIIMSITLFVVNHYRELYRIGISTGLVYYSERIKTTGQNKQVMFIEINIINESAIPVTIIGMSIVEHEYQTYDSDNGEFINKSITVEDKKQIYNKQTNTLPIVIPPYSTFQGVCAFYHSWIYSQNYFIELETPKRFLTFPFNPQPETYVFSSKRRGRLRKIEYYWRQNPIRTVQNKIIHPFLKAEEWWNSGGFSRLLNKIKSFGERLNNIH